MTTKTEKIEMKLMKIGKGKFLDVQEFMEEHFQNLASEKENIKNFKRFIKK